jgi:predicted enzyme related to lactoylglutathione lyase
LPEHASNSRTRLSRIALYVDDIAAAVAGYELVLEIAPSRVGPGRVYFHSEGAILAIVDPGAEGHGVKARPNAAPLYFAVVDLDGAHERALRAGFDVVEPPAMQPWGERSFYARDASGNRLCFVDAATFYTGLEPNSNG